MSNRRIFIKKAGLATATLPLFQSNVFGGFKNHENAMHPICYFTKHLQWLDFDDLGIALKEAGFDGADLTVRPGGHVEPEEAAVELPKAVTALQKHGISMPMVVAKIADPKEKGAADLLQALADNGVKYYRMGYLNYDYAISMEMA